MTCPACGNALASGHERCAFCGALVAPSAEGAHCQMGEASASWHPRLCLAREIVAKDATALGARKEQVVT